MRPDAPGCICDRFGAVDCTSCRMCEAVCPHGVFIIENGKARLADRDACMECGACARNCPADALTVDSGVGCAWGIIMGALRGTEPTCGCDEDDPKDSNSCC